jgi:hypothetical protein
LASDWRHKMPVKAGEFPLAGLAFPHSPGARSSSSSYPPAGIPSSRCSSAPSWRNAVQPRAAGGTLAPPRPRPVERGVLTRRKGPAPPGSRPFAEEERARQRGVPGGPSWISSPSPRRPSPPQERARDVGSLCIFLPSPLGLDGGELAGPFPAWDCSGGSRGHRVDGERHLPSAQSRREARASLSVGCEISG